MGSDKNRLLQTESFAWGREGAIKRWPYERKEGIKCVCTHQVKPVVPFFQTCFKHFFYFAFHNNKTKAWQLDYFYKQ